MSLATEDTENTEHKHGNPNIPYTLLFSTESCCFLSFSMISVLAVAKKHTAT